MIDAPDPEKEHAKNLQSLALFGVITSDLLGFTGIGFGSGYYLWKVHHWPWWVVVITSGAGFCTSMIFLYKHAKKAM